MRICTNNIMGLPVADLHYFRPGYMDRARETLLPSTGDLCICTYSIRIYSWTYYSRTLSKCGRTTLCRFLSRQDDTEHEMWLSSSCVTQCQSTALSSSTSPKSWFTLMKHWLILERHSQSYSCFLKISLKLRQQTVFEPISNFQFLSGPFCA